MQFSDFVPCLRFEKMKHFLQNRVRQSRLVSESTLLDAVLIGHLSNPTTSPKRHLAFTDKAKVGSGADPNLAKKSRIESVTIEATWFASFEHTHTSLLSFVLNLRLCLVLGLCSCF
jgi:hypothetical protein